MAMTAAWFMWLECLERQQLLFLARPTRTLFLIAENLSLG